MAYTKIELAEPIYELQDNETERQYYFFNLFLHADMNASEFAKSFNDLKKGDYWEQDNSNVKLNFNPPKFKTFMSWSSYNQWKIRKREYWKCKLNDIREELQQDLVEFFKKDSVNLRKSAMNDWRLDREIDTDLSTPPHLKSKGKNDLATAHQKKVDTLLTEAGMPSDISQSDVNMNANVNGEVEITKDFFKDKEAYTAEDTKDILFNNDSEE